MSGAVSLNTLPTDVIPNILSFLDSGSLISTSIVCKLFMNYANSKDFWENRKERTTEDNILNLNKKEFISRTKNVNYILSKIFNNTPKIKNIYLQNAQLKKMKLNNDKKISYLIAINKLINKFIDEQDSYKINACIQIGATPSLHKINKIQNNQNIIENLKRISSKVIQHEINFLYKSILKRYPAFNACLTLEETKAALTEMAIPNTSGLIADITIYYTCIPLFKG